jgi:hypothetical protein
MIRRERSADMNQPPGSGGPFQPPQGGFPPPPQGGFAAPPQGGFAVPPQGGFAAPPQGGFAAPPQGGFPPPPQGGFAAPPQGGFPPPPQGGFPPPQGYGQPYPAADFQMPHGGVGGQVTYQTAYVGPAEEKPGVIAYFKGIPMASARMAGLKAIGLGALILGINFALLFMNGTFLPFILPFAFPLLFAGPWMLVLGQPRDEVGRPKMWARVIVGLSALAGALIGVGATIAMCE